MNWLIELLTNKVIIATLAGTIVTQLLKVIIELVKDHKVSKDTIIKTGGMPSSHAGAIVAMTTGLYLEYGFGPGFIIAIVLTVVILRDAMGVRKTVGELGIKFNEMMAKDGKKNSKPLYIHQGHTFAQVIVGSIIGWILAVLICGAWI